MIKQSFKLYFLILKKQKAVSAINILGMAIGIAVVIMLGAYVHKQFSADRFHENEQQIYKLGKGTNAAPLADLLKDHVPEIEKIVRIESFFTREVVMKNESNRTLTVRNFIFADSTFFDVFDFKVIAGNPSEALKTPRTLVITEHTAKKLFGDEPAIGKSLSYRAVQKDKFQEFTVGAVVENPPVNSLFNFNVVAPFNFLRNVRGKNVFTTWNNYNYSFFALTRSNINASELENSLNTSLAELRNKEEIDNSRWNPIPLRECYWGLDHFDTFRHENKQITWVLFIAGLLTLIVAVINGVNLTAASALIRVNEVGVRKSHGATRASIIRQFILESVLSAFIAWVIAILIAEISLPLFNNIIGREILTNITGSVNLMLLSLLGAVIIGTISGIYPAIFLNSFKLVESLKKQALKGNRGSIFQKGLVVFQFIVSIILISGTLAILKQNQFMRNKDLGFEKENILITQLPYEIYSKMDLFKKQLDQYPNLKVAQSQGTPGSFLMTWARKITNDKGETKQIGFNAAPCDHNYISLMNFEIIKGENFKETTQKRSLIVNEAFLKKADIQDPFTCKIKDKNIVGVVKDFNFSSLHSEITPFAFVYLPGWSNSLSVRIKASNYNDLNNEIKNIRSVFAETAPEIPFEYRFLNDQLDTLYKSEDRLNKLFGFFSVLALVIGTLGILGLSIFMMKRRVKEIGVRRVNGAKIGQILLLLNKDFIKWIMIAFVIATPTAYYILSKWMQNFAYKTTLSWWIFGLAGTTVLIIALLTVSWQSWTNARKNPVEALRYE